MTPLTQAKKARHLAIRAMIAAGVAAAFISASATAASATPTHCKPTIVLEHGAWLGGSSWYPVAAVLRARGYKVDIAPNDVRSLSADTAQLRSYLTKVHGPVVLVGHSYGGAVISDAAVGNKNIKALVYDDAYIPAAGENIATLSGPDSALAPVATDPTSVFKLEPYAGAPAGIYNTYLLPNVLATDFAPDLPVLEQKYLTKTQPPASLLALGEPSGAVAWPAVPSWDIVGKEDKVIPPAAQLAMAKRAGSHVTQIDSSHVSLLSHPVEVAAVIVKAARATS